MTNYKGYEIVKRVPETSCYLYDIFTTDADGRRFSWVGQAFDLLHAKWMIDNRQTNDQ